MSANEKLDNSRKGDDDALPSANLPGPDPSAQSMLARWGKWWGKKETSVDKGNAANDETSTVSQRNLTRWRSLLRPCFQARLTDVAANRAARTWQEQYQAADAAHRRGMLDVLGEIGSVAPATSEPALEGEPLAKAMSEARVRFFRRINALPDGLKFLLALRADMLHWRKHIPTLQALDADLEGLLSHWFDVGLLELRRMTWDSPASLLEKLITYEAVHEISSWADLRNRLDSDRRCYAFFHPRIPNEPLIFVEVAFSADMADSVQSILDEAAPVENLDKARWAIFYSISNTQAGLRGVSFGNFLLKRVIDELASELPKIKKFATLSPIPGFSDWLKKQSVLRVSDMLGTKRRKKGGEADDVDPDAKTGAQMLAMLQQATEDDSDAHAQALKLAAHYLVHGGTGGVPADPVARFHLGNGARVERLVWGADLSKKGRAQSCSMMVNYLYELEELDANLAKLGYGKPEISRAIARLL